MNKMRKLKLRTISLVLTFAMVMGCVCSTAAAETSVNYVDRRNENSVQRVYDSGNVVLLNQVTAAAKKNTFKIKLDVKIGDISKLTAKTNSVSSAALSSAVTTPVSSEVESSAVTAPASSSTDRKVVLDRAPLPTLAAAPLQEEATYEVRYYIHPDFEVVESTIPKNAVLEEDEPYVSWSKLTAQGIRNFSAGVELQRKATEDAFDDSNLNSEDRSGVYQDGEPVYLFAQSNLLNAAQLPPITAKTAKLNNWDDRTYDINLSVAAQSEIQTTQTPCDIILVLDRSGSMADPMYAPENNPIHSNTYYININGTYSEVTSNGSEWYYNNGWNWYRVYPLAGGTGSNRYYQFYTKSIATKLEALKTSANNFVDNVKENSPDSRIAVVSFSSNYYSSQEVTNNTGGLLQVSNSMATIQNAIDGLVAQGGTRAYSGMKMARDIYGADTMSTTDRKRIVVMFTDGEPGDQGFNNTDGYSAAASTINQATILKANLGAQTASDVKFNNYKGTSASGKGCNATVYSIGIFSGLSSDRLNLVEDYMKKVASGADKYYPASDANALKDIFASISHEVGGISGAKVTDVIDPRFELTLDSKNQLISSGATITNNADGSQTITWSNQKINVKKDTQGNLIPDWTKTFTVKAKDQFIGGNAIPTNVEVSSGVTYGSSQFEKFPHPTVNVKPGFKLGNAETTIFYGESVPTTTLDKYGALAQQDVFCGKPATGTFAYQWVKADGTTQIGTDEAFPANQLPNGDTYYTLKGRFIPSAATAQSNENSTLNNTVYTAGMTDNSVVTNSAEGKYTVNVIKGQLNITKNIDKKYPAPVEVNAKQSLVFKIERRDTQTGPAADTFYEVITLPDSLSASKTITGLKKGYYQVTEVTGDAWRYTQTAVSDNDTISDAGTVFIGRDTSAPDAIAKSYFGTGANEHGVAVNPAAVIFTNSLKNNQWLGDTTVAVNTIRHAS